MSPKALFECKIRLRFVIYYHSLDALPLPFSLSLSLGSVQPPFLHLPLTASSDISNSTCIIGMKLVFSLHLCIAVFSMSCWFSMAVVLLRVQFPLHQRVSLPNSSSIDLFFLGNILWCSVIGILNMNCKSVVLGRGRIISFMTIMLTSFHHEYLKWFNNNLSSSQPSWFMFVLSERSRGKTDAHQMDNGSKLQVDL